MVFNVILYNMDEVVCLGLCIGDMVVICCVGDVILQVMQVVFECCLVDVQVIEVFEYCLVCGLVVEWIQLVKCSKGKELISEGVIYCCVGCFFCQVQLKQVIIYFVLCWVMDIDGFGDKIVE